MSHETLYTQKNLWSRNTRKKFQTVVACIYLISFTLAYNLSKLFGAKTKQSIVSKGNKKRNNCTLLMFLIWKTFMVNFLWKKNWFLLKKFRILTKGTRILSWAKNLVKFKSIFVNNHQNFNCILVRYLYTFYGF